MDNINKLMIWLNNNNFKGVDINFKKKSGDRSVYSKKNITQNKLVAQIPLKCIIHDGMAENTQIGREFLTADHSECHNIKLTLIVIYMLSTISENSFYKEYYNILPNKLSHFPIFWRDSTINILKGSNFIDDINKRKQNFINDFNVLCNCSPTFKANFTFLDFVNMRTIVGSRNFGITINNIRRSAMVPLADMFNHDYPPNVTWAFNDETNCFEMISNQNILANTEINDSYGNKCNSKLLLFYGFILDNKQANSLKIKIKDVKTKISYLGILTKTIDNNFNLLFAFIRSLICKVNSYTFTNFNEPINIDIEICSFKYLNKYLHKRLNQYHTKTLLFKKIDKIDKTDNSKTAVKFVLGEIDIIEFYIDMCESCLNFFNKNIKPSNKEFLRYVEELDF